MNDKTAILALNFIPGLGNQLIKHLISITGNPEDALNSSVKTLKNIPGIGEKIILSIRNNREEAIEKALKEENNLIEFGGRYITYLDQDYPRRLKESYDYPVILFIKGDVNLSSQKVVSIVGTRKSTSYGKSITQEIIQYLSRFDALIVSGLAYGIDIESHTQALNHGLETVGVMASGLDHIYPPSHESTVAKMIKNKSGIMTEYPLGTEPERQQFPARNRIIAGMADAVIVVEAAERGGALITAFMANDNNREVFAVPGNLHSKYSEGCNLLIRNHKANILTKPEDIGYILNWDNESRKTLKIPFDELSEPERKVIEFLKENLMESHIDQIMINTELSHSFLSSTLLQLEIKGYITNLPGKRYRLHY